FRGDFRREWKRHYRSERMQHFERDGAQSGLCAGQNCDGRIVYPTAGVTITQPNSPYPDMVIDATGTNTVPFQLSTSPGFVCGTAVRLTLVTTYPGGTST